MAPKTSPEKTSAAQIKRKCFIPASSKLTSGIVDMNSLAAEIVEGSNHVPDPIFGLLGTISQSEIGNEFTSSKQCTAISMMAIATRFVKNPAMWSAGTIDDILLQGDKLYEKSVKCIAEKTGNPVEYRILSTNEVASSFFAAGKDVSVQSKAAAIGFHCGVPDLSFEEAGMKPFLLIGAEEVLSSDDVSGAILTSYGYSVAIWKFDSKYCLFDSHKRNIKGGIDHLGTAFCGSYTSLKDLLLAYYQNFRGEDQCVKNDQWELTPVSVKVARTQARASVSDTDLMEDDSGGEPTPKRPRMRKRKRVKQYKWERGLRADTRRRMTVRDVLCEAGFQKNEVTEGHILLATKIISQRQFLIKQEKIIDELRREIERMKSETVSEYLTRHEVSESLIMQVDCHIRNVNKDPRGYRFNMNEKTYSASFCRVSSRSLTVKKEGQILPGHRTANNIVRDVDLKCGINLNGPLIQTVKTMVQGMEPVQKLVTVTWDETDVQEFLIMCKRQGMVIGLEDFGDGDRSVKPADKVLLFLVQGILDYWRFPFAFFFAKGQTSHDRLEVIIPKSIEAMQEIGLKVLVTCCDQGSSNLAAIRTLEFLYPVVFNNLVVPGQFCVNGDNIIVTYDPSHIIKCMKSMLKDGYLEWPIDEDGDQVIFKFHWSVFQQLQLFLQKSGSASSFSKKVSDEHLNAQGRRRQRVHLSAELFSNTNSTLLENVGPSGVRDNYKASKVVRDINTLFDLTNGHSTAEAVRGNLPPAKQSFSPSSVHSDLIPHFIEKLKRAKFFSKSKTGNYVNNNRTPTLKNWIKTLQGLQALANTLSNLGFYQGFNPRVGVTQDHLECQFGELKQQALRFNKITCYMFTCFLKSVFITHLVVPPNVCGNVQPRGFNAQESLKTFLKNNPVVNVPSAPMDPIAAAMLDCEIDEDEFVTCVQSSPARNHTASTSDADGPPQMCEGDLSQTSADVLCQQLDHYEFVKISRDIRKSVLKGTTCVNCINDFTGSHNESIFENVFLWDASLAFEGLPSPRLAAFVKECYKLFEQNCRPLMHLPSFKNRLLREIGTVNWILCPEHKDERVETLKSKMCDGYANSLCRKINFQIKKNRKEKEKQRRDIVEQALSDAFSEVD